MIDNAGIPSFAYWLCAFFGKSAKQWVYHEVRLKMICKLQTLKPNKDWACLIFILALSITSLACANEETKSPVEQLAQDFVMAFNSGDSDTLASFYQHGASTSFNERRTEEENRALYQILVDKFGTLTYETVDAQESGGARLLAVASKPGKVAEFRFKLVGNPPLIDGFSAGINPADNADTPAADTASKTDHAMPGHDSEDGLFAFLTSEKGVHQTQLFLQSDGSLLLVWVQKGPYDLDLFTAREKPDGAFSRPLRINQRGLNRYTGDEARPSVTLGPEGAVAVAWTANNNDIMLAIGYDYGEQFAAEVKLNQDEGEAERTMPSVALSPDGVAHVVWLDPREAPRGMEEPSDLYFASLVDGTVQELNLTANQDPTVCGCCRPFIAIDEGSNFNILFRNSDANGYRDISRINGVSGALGEPQPTSPPIWKLNACPSAGPISSAGGTLWKDASTGSWRLLWSTDPNVAPAELLTDQADLELTYSPRTVSGREAWVLIGARPHGLIAEWKDGAWQVVLESLPRWASSAVVKEGQLILVGNEKGQFYTETRRL